MNRSLVWSGRIVTAIAIALLSLDAFIKFLNIPEVLQSFSRLGYDPRVAVIIGSLELLCIALYLVPRTSIAGAVLFTGYLGGAVASHLRIGDPLLTHILSPLYAAILLWAGLTLRDERTRALLFLKEN